MMQRRPARMKRTRTQPIPRTIRQNEAARGGIALLETVITFVPLMLLLFAGIQFSLTSAVESTVSAATHEAARCYAIGGDIDEASAMVGQMLNVHGITIGPGVRLVIQDDTGAIQSQGDGTLTSDSLLTAPPAGTVRAVLIVDVNATPAPNMLTAYCVDFSERQFQSSSVTTLFKECP